MCSRHFNFLVECTKRTFPGNVTVEDKWVQMSILFRRTQKILTRNSEQLCLECSPKTCYYLQGVWLFSAAPRSTRFHWKQSKQEKKKQTRLVGDVCACTLALLCLKDFFRLNATHHTAPSLINKSSFKALFNDSFSVIASKLKMASKLAPRTINTRVDSEGITCLGMNGMSVSDRQLSLLPRKWPLGALKMKTRIRNTCKVRLVQVRILFMQEISLRIKKGFELRLRWVLMKSLLELVPHIHHWTSRMSTKRQIKIKQTTKTYTASSSK